MPAQSRRDLATKNSASSPAHGLSDEDPGLASGQHGNGARQDALRASGAVESASADPFDVSAWMTEGLDEGFERPLPGRARLESLLGVSFAGVKLRVGVSSLDNLDAEGSYHQGELCFAETRPSDEFLNQCLDILRVAVGDARAENIVEMCLQIANASGGFMNIGKVSGEEKARIAAIAEALGPAARDAFHRELG